MAGEDRPPQLRIFRDAPPTEQAEILVLGTFHFKDAGLDEYKPRHDIDILSSERQAELEQVLERLADFNPTRIALEVRYERQASLDSSYAAYLAGDLQLSSKEIHQIGFRLAKRLGHPRVYACDAPRQSLYGDVRTREQWNEKVGQGVMHGLESEVWDTRFSRLYAHDDSVKIHRSLTDTFLYMNSPERLMTGHGHYLIGTFQLSNDEEYIGPNFGISWYVRNLRIFHNLIRITESTEDRILLLIGAGHVPIIAHAIDASPHYRLVSVSEILGQ